MTHAYSESYLSNAKDRLSSFFDYAINDCGMKPDWITALFVNTGYAEQFERGNPAYLAGMSGVELARAVILKAYGKKELPHPTHSEDCSPEYWAGWALAEYQWFRPPLQRHLPAHPHVQNDRYVHRLPRNGHLPFHQRYGSPVQSCRGRFQPETHPGKPWPVPGRTCRAVRGQCPQYQNLRTVG